MQKYKINRRLITVNCDNCGVAYEKPITEYTRNTKLNRHSFCSRTCSCKFGNVTSPSNLRPNRKHEHLKGYTRADIYTPFKNLLRSSKRRFKEVDIDLPYLKELWEKQQGICIYSGVALTLQHYKKHVNDNPIYNASLDRIDSSKGYIKGNIQFVSQCINYCKNTMSHEQMLEVCKNIALFYNKLHISM